MTGSVRVSLTSGIGSTLASFFSWAAERAGIRRTMREALCISPFLKVVSPTRPGPTSARIADVQPECEPGEYTPSSTCHCQRQSESTPSLCGNDTTHKSQQQGGNQSPK